MNYNKVKFGDTQFNWNGVRLTPAKTYKPGDALELDSFALVDAPGKTVACRPPEKSAWVYTAFSGVSFEQLEALFQICKQVDGIIVEQMKPKLEDFPLPEGWEWSGGSITRTSVSRRSSLGGQEILCLGSKNWHCDMAAIHAALANALEKLGVP